MDGGREGGWKEGGKGEGGQGWMEGGREGGKGDGWREGRGKGERDGWREGGRDGLTSIFRIPEEDTLGLFSTFPKNKLGPGSTEVFLFFEQKN